MENNASALYGSQRSRKLAGGNEISSSTTLSFTSQLSSLINTGSSNTISKPKISKYGAKKDDIFTTHNRNTAKRAKRDLEDAPSFEQKHTTNGEGLDKSIWARSKRKMEEKARIYAAMKRGDVGDTDERYAVDFDKKWAESQADGEDAEEMDDDQLSDDDEEQTIEYTDEFGRTRTGTQADAARSARVQQGKRDVQSDRFTARPTAPTNVIYGDTIQHQAFDPDEPVAAQMEELAKKRDKSLTPPPEQHFDSKQEIRNKGTGFFQFSGDVEERKRQMDGLEGERAETERRRKERDAKLDERKSQIAARRAEINQKRGKRKADDFLDQLGDELSSKGVEQSTATDMTERIESAIQREEDEQA